MAWPMIAAYGRSGLCGEYGPGGRVNGYAENSSSPDPIGPGEETMFTLRSGLDSGVDISGDVSSSL